MGFEENGVVFLNQSSIIGQTFHWHDELELLIVVEGSIDLKVGYEWFRIKAGNMMLINSDEIHSIKETNEKNIVISVYIDCNITYEKYPDFYEIVALWPYSEAFNKLNQRRYIIMEHVSRLAVLIKKNEEKEKIIHHLDAFLKSLIYCYRLDITDLDGAAFQITDDKMDMIYRVIKYLYTNYDQKVKLQEISEQEYLSLFYLSHKFKDITGFSFRDWLNFVRVEKAEKMLLETPYPITEIACHCGFSDVRYFNKHFMKWYKISPTKYRKLFRESYEMQTDAQRFEKDVSMTEIINKIEAIVPDQREETRKKVDIIIDLDKTSVIERFDPTWKENLWCRASNVLGYRQKKQIEEAQNDIGFVSIIVDELFSSEVIQTEDASVGEIHDILNFLLNSFSKVYLVVNCSKEDQYEVETAEVSLKSFFRFYAKSRATQLGFKIDMADNEEETKKRVEEFIALLSSCHVRYERYEKYKKPSDSLRAVKGDYISNLTDSEIRLDWLYSKNGFRNNLYYMYLFLAQMGEAIVLKEDGYFVTRKEDDVQILFYNEGAALQYKQETPYNLTLKNLNADYKVVHYVWDSERDDITSIIKNYKVIKHLTDTEFKVIERASAPMVSVEYIEGKLANNEECGLKLPLFSTSIRLTLLIKI